ncbi:hypothetical protein Taro_010011 [Colocasia esculenta]|uniref:Uncharacterized protein n=1 Tax=Colocasia esculenta TaxID=4460 RepID=A0A843TXU1_COLES|nr:hypothetical protein [Colocasia esculenta]
MTPTVVTSPVGCPRFFVSQAVSSGVCPGTCVVPSMGDLNGKVDCRLVIVGGIGVAVYPILAAIVQAVNLLSPSRHEFSMAPRRRPREGVAEQATR